MAQTDFNGINGLFVIRTEIIKFKAKYSETTAYYCV